MAVVYIFQAEGTTRVKIGRTASLTKRRHAIHTASPFPVRVLRAIDTDNAVRLEAMLHQRYRAHRRHREWFELPQEILEALLLEVFPNVGPSSVQAIAPLERLRHHPLGPTPVSPEYALVHLLYHCPQYLGQARQMLDGHTLVDSDLQELYRALEHRAQTGEAIPLADMRTPSELSRQTQLATQIAMLPLGLAAAEVARALGECIGKIRDRVPRARRQAIIEQLRTCPDGSAEQQQLLHEYDKLSRTPRTPHTKEAPSCLTPQPFSAPPATCA
jgi:hypothetical protein